MTEQNAIESLCRAVERKAHRRMRTPKDFDALSTIIFDELHIMVSASTLKRIWGYVKTDSMPRPSSLDPLAQYVGYADWDDFMQRHNDSLLAGQKRHLWRWLAGAVGVLLLALACWLLAGRSGVEEPQKTAIPSGKRVLHKGQDCFRTTPEYLVLFGISATDTAYFQPIAALPHLYAWGPEYGNPIWHNEGDKQQLMPTITEYYTPSDKTEDYIKLANEKLYYERLEADELRITFMRDIVDSLYVFLGVYRMDRELSTKEKFVWRRVADDCDLGLLPQLQQLRE